MSHRKGTATQEEMTLPTILFLAVIVVFPWPVGVLLGLGIPFGWIYLVVYLGWVGFASVLGWLILQSPPRQDSRWPHKPVMKFALAAALIWLFITNFFPRAVNPAVAAFISTALIITFLLEFAVIMGRGLARSARPPSG